MQKREELELELQQEYQQKIAEMTAVLEDIRELQHKLGYSVKPEVVELQDKILQDWAMSVLPATQFYRRPAGKR